MLYVTSYLFEGVFLRHGNLKEVSCKTSKLVLGRADARVTHQKSDTQTNFGHKNNHFG